MKRSSLTSDRASQTRFFLGHENNAVIVAMNHLRLIFGGGKQV